MSSRTRGKQGLRIQAPKLRSLSVGEEVVFACVGDDRVGEETKITGIAERHFSGHAGEIRHFYSVEFTDGSNFLYQERRDLYAPGDEHLDAKTLKQVLLANIAWKASRRYHADGSYKPAVGDVGNKYAHLRGRKVLVPRGVPSWTVSVEQWDGRAALGAPEWRLTQIERVVTVYGTTPGQQADAAGKILIADPLICWRVAQSIVCVPADLVLRVTPADVVRPAGVDKVKF